MASRGGVSVVSVVDNTRSDEKPSSEVEYVKMCSVRV